MRSDWGTIDPGELRSLVDRGMSQAEIAAHLSEKYHQPVKRGSVSSAMHRHDIRSPRREPHTDLIPWRVAVEHSTDYAAQMLRTEGRVRRGTEASKYQLGRLASWKRNKLRGGELVVDYNPVDGFTYVPRREGVDTDLIRIPDELLPPEQQEA